MGSGPHERNGVDARPIALLALQNRSGLPRWLGVVTAVALVEQLVETITISGKTGFIAPGGTMDLMLGAYLTTIAFFCTGVAVARTTRDADPLGARTAPKSRLS